MIVMNCSDLKKFGAILEQLKLKECDTANNSVDKIYNLELIQ